MAQRESWRWWCVLGCLPVLAACAGNGDQSAWRVMQEQQNQQAQLRAREEAELNAQAANEPGMLRTLAQQNYSQQRYFAALAYVDDYRRRFGNIDGLEAIRADALMKTGQPDASRQEYEAMLRTANRAQGLHGLGLLAGEAGDYVLAERHFREAAALAPTQPEILNDLAYARINLGDYAGARIPLGQALELGREESTVLANMALLLMLEGRMADARQLMNGAGLSEESQAGIAVQAARIRAQGVLGAAWQSPTASDARLAAAVPPAADVAGVAGAPVVTRAPAAPESGAAMSGTQALAAPVVAPAAAPVAAPVAAPAAALDSGRVAIVPLSAAGSDGSRRAAQAPQASGRDEMDAGLLRRVLERFR